MSKFKTTIVTMFFNLKKLEDQSIETRPISFYTEQCVHVLRLKYPMVLFCDSDSLDILRTIREREVGYDIPTKYIVKDIIDYDYYKQNVSIIRENRAQYNADAYINSRNTPSYFLLSMFKCIALLLAKQENPFQTDYYAWIDIGCNHVVQGISEYAPKMLEEPNPKISMCYIHYRRADELSDMRNYMRWGGKCGIAAGAFTVHKDYVERLYTYAFSIFYEMLSKGVGHSEETVFTYMANRYPDLFTFYNGDYYSLFTNYHLPRRDIQAIIYHYIRNADPKYAHEASCRLLLADVKKVITLTEEEKKMLRLNL
jgi:hypothetical protein